jgi:hypothetical protein
VVKIQCIILRRSLQYHLLNPKFQIIFGTGIAPTEPFQDGQVRCREKHEASGGKTVSTSSAYFLAIVLKGFWHIKMYNLVADYQLWIMN